MPAFERYSSGGTDRAELLPKTLIVAGWTGRDEKALHYHIEELAAIGVPRPSSVPVFYRISTANLTQTARLEVLGPDTSGEAEPVVLRCRMDSGLALAPITQTVTRKRSASRCRSSFVPRWSGKPCGAAFFHFGVVSAMRIGISCAVILMTSSASLSRDGGLPQFDIQKQCQKIQRAADELTGTKNPGAFDSCVKNEQSAREKLAERWTTISALDKTSCVHPVGWSPSYSEWLGCLDTRDYTRTMRKDHTESMAASKLCPTVNWQLDGSITSVVACQQR